MTLEERLYRRPFAVRILIALALVAASVASYAFFTGRAAEAARQDVRERALETLGVQSDAVLRYLEKYRYLPALIANNPEVAEALSRREAIPFRLALSLLRTANYSGAIDIALLRTDGSMVHSVSGFLKEGMVENNELLAAPLQLRLGRASISGEDGRRAYAFSTAIAEGGNPLGIAVVVAPLETVEQAWALVGNPVFAINRAGQVVASNLFARGDDERISEVLAAIARAVVIGDDREVTIPGYQVHHRLMPILDWDLHVLEPDWTIGRSRQTAGTIVVLGAALLSVLLFGSYSRGLNRYRQQRRDRATALKLERRVRDRTRELRNSNERLEIEVGERAAAEAMLKKTQQELIQAEKLAAIGQMSATLAHEYNQPLAAVRSYAENAVRFIERGQEGNARGNLERISAVVDRLAQLSKTLLSFARRPDEKTMPVDLAAALAEAVLLVSDRAGSQGVEIDTSEVAPVLPAMGETLRLVPVLVNLLANAIDACAHSKERRIVVKSQQLWDTVSLSIRDTGTGIEEEHLARVFDPFFTTKDVGEGLGLGMSIAYNTVRDFGGHLSASNHPDGGAVFVLRLKAPQDVADPESNAGARPAKPRTRERSL